MGAPDDIAGIGTRDAVRPGTLSALLRELAAAPPVDVSDGDAGLYPGLAVGRFELVRELGRGGFGVVWEAKDRELGRRVAFKLVRAGGRRELSEERLLREAEAAAQLSHENIVTLHDVGRTERGPYLVLELLEGETLARRLRGGPLHAREALRVASDVARALGHAHDRGVVHRDLKPENVFVCRDGRVKVLDFGLAHAFGHRAPSGGTRGYMAPEQVEGAPEDERTDVWALGVMLFEMLSGQRPFDDAGQRGAAPALDVAGLPALGALVGRMLAVRAVDRPRDGAEVLAALLAVAGEIADDDRFSAGVTIRSAARARWAGRLAAAVALASAVAVGAWWGLRPRGPPASPSPAEPVSLAVLPLANLSGDAGQDYFSEGMTEEITGKLSRLRGLAVTARGSAAKYRGAQKDAREIGAELRVAYLVEGSVRRAGDRIRVTATLVKTADAFQLWSESIDARLDDVFDVQERVARRIVDALQIRLGPDEAGSLARWGTRNAAAYDEYLRGFALVERYNRRENVEGSRGHFERALQFDPGFAPAMVGLAFAEMVIYRDFETTPEGLTRARALLDRAFAIDPHAPRALLISALLRAVTYDYRGAAEDVRQVTVAEPRNYTAWDALCFMLGYTTPPGVTEGENACRRALELNPGFSEAEYHLTRILALQGRLAEAEETVGRLAERAPGSPFVHSGRFWIHLASKQPRAALEELGKQPKFVRDTAVGKVCMSMALAQAGELDRAFAELEGALAKGYGDVAGLHGNLYFGPLRRDPRFAALLARHGIPAPAAARAP